MTLQTLNDTPKIIDSSISVENIPKLEDISKIFLLYQTPVHVTELISKIWPDSSQNIHFPTLMEIFNNHQSEFYRVHPNYLFYGLVTDSSRYESISSNFPSLSEWLVFLANSRSISINPLPTESQYLNFAESFVGIHKSLSRSTLARLWKESIITLLHMKQTPIYIEEIYLILISAGITPFDPIDSSTSITRRSSKNPFASPPNIQPITLNKPSKASSVSFNELASLRSILSSPDFIQFSKTDYFGLAILLNVYNQMGQELLISHLHNNRILQKFASSRQYPSNSHIQPLSDPTRFLKKAFCSSYPSSASPLTNFNLEDIIDYEPLDSSQYSSNSSYDSVLLSSTRRKREASFSRYSKKAKKSNHSSHGKLGRPRKSKLSQSLSNWDPQNPLVNYLAAFGSLEAFNFTEASIPTTWSNATLTVLENLGIPVHVRDATCLVMGLHMVTSRSINPWASLTATLSKLGRDSVYRLHHRYPLFGLKKFKSKYEQQAKPHGSMDSYLEWLIENSPSLHDLSLGKEPHFPLSEATLSPSEYETIRNNKTDSPKFIPILAKISSKSIENSEYNDGEKSHKDGSSESPILSTEKNDSFSFDNDDFFVNNPGNPELEKSEYIEEEEEPALKEGEHCTNSRFNHIDDEILGDPKLTHTSMTQKKLISVSVTPDPKVSNAPSFFSPGVDPNTSLDQIRIPSQFIHTDSPNSIPSPQIKNPPNLLDINQLT